MSSLATTSYGLNTTIDYNLRRPDPVYVMDLLPGLVGWIIGRSGTRIKDIQQHYSCKMWVDQDVPDNQPRKLYFQGTSQSIKLAVNSVNELLLDAPLLGGKHGEVENILSKIAECPAELVGLLIGRKGWTIKKIQCQSGAQIAINQSVRDGLPRKIIVSGDEISVYRAISLIHEVLSTRSDDNTGIPSGTFIGSRGQHSSKFRAEETRRSLDLFKKQRLYPGHTDHTVDQYTFPNSPLHFADVPRSSIEHIPTSLKPQQQKTLHPLIFHQQQMNDEDFVATTTSSGSEESFAPLQPQPSTYSLNSRYAEPSVLHGRFPVINYHANDTLFGKAATTSTRVDDRDYQLQTLLESLSIGNNTPYTTNNNHTLKSMESYNNTTNTNLNIRNTLHGRQDYEMTNVPSTLAYPYHPNGLIGTTNVNDTAIKSKKFMSAEINSDGLDAYTFLINKGIW